MSSYRVTFLATFHHATLDCQVCLHRVTVILSFSHGDYHEQSHGFTTAGGYLPRSSSGYLLTLIRLYHTVMVITVVRHNISAHITVASGWLTPSGHQIRQASVVCSILVTTARPSLGNGSPVTVLHSSNIEATQNRIDSSHRPRQYLLSH